MPTSNDAAELDRALAAAHKEIEQLHEQNGRLLRRLTELDAASSAMRESRRAALNVMEDAMRSNRIAESLNLELKHEVAERKRAEEALQASEDRLRTLADEVPQIIWSNDAEGRANYFNRRWFEYSGLTFAESAGAGWQAIVHPDDAPASDQRWHEALSAGAPFDCEYRLRRHDGEYRWFIGRNVPLRRADGAITGWFGSATDIHDRKLAEAALTASQERLRLLVEGAVEHAIIAVDLQRRITSWNTGAERLLGYLREEIAHTSADLIFTPEDRQAGAPEHEVEVALREGRVTDERWHVRKDGTRFWGSGVMLPLYERPGGPPSGFIKILRDETARRETDQALERSRQELLAALDEAHRARAEAEAATRAKDDFLAALSHELRTPLNPVLLLASEAAEMGSLPAQVRENFHTIRSNIELEARLIDDLLDLTRISRGKLSLDLQDIDAHAVLRETIAIVQPEARHKRLGLQVDLAAVATGVRADPVRLAQVFWNVLKNAVKFTPEDGRIEVATHNVPGQPRLVITISDTGIGLTEREIGRVFDAFAQGEHADEGHIHRFGGLGLGLAISRTMVELHGGTIRATSPGRGHGATFEIELPTTAMSAQMTNGRVAPREPAISESLQRLRREHILLVEDHDATRDALATLLRRRGLVVECASSATEAREIAGRSPVTLLLSDIGLPDGYGYELMEELRERHGVRGIALTGYGTDEDLTRSRQAGFSAHLTKPITAQALDRTLAELVAEPRES